MLLNIPLPEKKAIPIHSLVALQFFSPALRDLEEASKQRWG